MKLQGDSFKTEVEVGAANRLLKDDQIYVTASSLNKTLKDAIENGDIAGGSADKTIVTTSTPNTKAITEANGTVFLHTASPGTTYQLPAASIAAGKRYTFVHRPIKTSDGTSVVVTAASNDKIDYFANGGTRVATLAASTYTHGNSGTSGTLGNAIKTAMDAASGDGGTYTVTFDRNTRTYTITRNASTFYFLFATGANLAATARRLMGFAPVDGSALITQVSDAPLFDELRIQPASGDRIRFGGDAIDNPGWLAIRKYGGSVTLVTESDDGWVVDKWNGQQHEKNYTIGQEPDVTIVLSNTWITGLGNMSQARSHMTGAGLNGYGYVFAGLTPPTTTTKSDILSYNDTTNAWTVKANSGTVARHSASCCAFNGFFYAAGGDTPAKGAELTRYNDSADTWTTRAAYSGSGGIVDANGFSLNGYGIFSAVSPGAGGTYLARYNDGTNAWSSLANSLTANRRGHINGGDAALNGYGYMVGGYGNPSGGNYSNMEQYNDSANSWILKSNLTSTATDGSMVERAGYLLVRIGTPNNSTGVSSANIYNDSLNVFAATPNEGSSSRVGSTGFKAGGYSYIAGGDVDYFSTFTHNSSIVRYN